MDFTESEWGDQFVGVFQKKGSSGCFSNSVQIADYEPGQHDATIDDHSRQGGEGAIEGAFSPREDSEGDEEQGDEREQVVEVPRCERIAVQEGEKGALRAAGGAGEAGEFVE